MRTGPRPSSSCPYGPCSPYASRREQHPCFGRVPGNRRVPRRGSGFVPRAAARFFAFPLAIVAYLALAPNRLRARAADDRAGLRALIT